MTISVTKKDEVYLKVKTDLSTDQELNDFFTFDVPGAKFMPLYRLSLIHISEPTRPY